MNSQSLDSEIGNYSQYIRDYNMCGLSRHSLPTETFCFKYNHGFGSDLKGARPALPLEAPWMVSIESRNGKWIGFESSTCGGVLIADNLVLTSAHCIE